MTMGLGSYLSVSIGTPEPLAVSWPLGMVFESAFSS